MTHECKRLLSRGGLVNGETSLAEDFAPAIASRRIVVDVEHRRHGFGSVPGGRQYLGSHFNLNLTGAATCPSLPTAPAGHRSPNPGPGSYRLSHRRPEGAADP